MRADRFNRSPLFGRTSFTSFLLAVCLCAAVAAQEIDGLSDDEPLGQKPATEDASAGTQPLAELEQLLQSAVEMPALQQEVTTVTGQQSTVGRSPAAVFVITQEMIHRSGARSIPEALRMAPGLQVARINSNQWAVTSRGFNTNIGGIFATNNKLLVLIDGRTVYTPFYNGTYWDVQDVLLEDIDRIEVIRGPGATIWGANAVNGVINVITKRAADTQGGLANVGGGSEERGFANARVGGKSGENVHYRVYGKWFERDASFVPGASEAADDWRQGRGGFRVDWTPSCDDLVTLQGDIYGGESGFLNTSPAPDVGDDEVVRGGNMLTRWTRTFSDDSDASVQFYYDRADRENNIGFLDQQFDTYDIDFRHHLPFGSFHNVIWGLGYRSVHDKLSPLTAPPNTVLSFDPAQRTYETYSAFLQDEITLTEALYLTPGAKVQHNDFTGWEVQPSARLLYAPEQSWAAWAAVSRAVRTPSRIEHDGLIAAGTVPFLDFTRDFDSEELIAYELGYRSQPETWFSWDTALFFNQYENLGSLRLTPPGILPILNSNDNRGEGYGAELSSTVDLTPLWRVTGSYSFLQLQIHPGASSVNFLGSNGEAVEGSSPHNQVYLMSSHDLTEDVQLDFIGRYVDELPALRVSNYIEMDVRMAWRPLHNTEFAVVGQNLLDSHHLEYPGVPSNEIERGVYGMVTHYW